MLNPVHLRTLAAVLNAGSFAGAARSLGYTGSAVSQQIAALERVVRVPLFERGAHTITPTSAARYLVLRSVDVLSALDALEEDVRGLCEGTIGRLRVGSFPTASRRLLPVALAAYARTHPSVETHLDEGEPDELVPLVRAGELDLALVYRYDLVPRAWPRDLHQVRLLEEELLVLLPERHSLAGAERIGLDDLKHETWVATREGTAGAAFLRGLCAQAGYQPRVDHRSGDYGVIRGFVRSGLGVALVPALAHQPGEGVVATGLDGVAARRRIGAVYRSRTTNPTVGGAVRALRQAAARLGEGGHPGLSYEAGGDAAQDERR
ncbi:LysR family transcriptional regulator [Nonomuraea sp. 3-1Str]|uniref:LysR family transcriptional regulator n=1 Tax=Nonomuraea sp. 3-1Str TaxID=2929801 RepID=UPI00286549C3|nr:LysR family transcriptional regulator [Nonomuraea sp. 3-1Str]MDR8413035.1 LysR family transcriptional regulator [Nonomuraea sp. 3-1Str]